VSKLKRELFDGEMSYQAALFAEQIANKSNVKLNQGYCIHNYLTNLKLCNFLSHTDKHIC
jgi:hypothetical protein